MPEGPEVLTESLAEEIREEVAIALGAVAALTKSRPVWFASLLLGAAATALFAMTLLR